MARASTYTHRGTGNDDRPKSSDAPKKELWSSMLDGVSSGKRLPEKSVLVLGGTPETQKDFLDSIRTDPEKRRRPPDRGRKPPIANQFALGYTYQDVLDTDQEDTLARLSLYLLTDSSPSFTPLLKPLLTTRTLPNMLAVILLDWGQPWAWVRQLRDWIRALRSLMSSLDDKCKDILEENIAALRDRGRSRGIDTALATAYGNVPTPLGPGEWDEPLGIPLCVVCQNADKIEKLERERSWKDDEFDFVLQYIRTILLKHGGGLIYTMPSQPGSLQALIHSSLGIQSTLEKKRLQYNIIDRDRVLVPPNWDSWGKIRALPGREGFDVEGISKVWSIEIQDSRTTRTERAPEDGGDEDALAGQASGSEQGSAVAMYEDTVRDPEQGYAQAHGLQSRNSNGIEVECTDNQTFLASQMEVLEKLRTDDEQIKAKTSREARKGAAALVTNVDTASGAMDEHIGPVQFNMGGIQVDADDMLQRLKDREANRFSDGEAAPITSPTDPRAENEYFASFFANLISKTGRGSAPSSPHS
ncbi:hypothetical protein H2201_008183 [Coniosporium apollinis]|uniref:Dynein light intermediate chain n=1 Tax=Coniosporium apollinis TaxID=61459 RepID=A0ABQ9NGT5_9PEZI|nr:hypothetical protein H2201_008183 [Coniosporium apollinis]